MGSAIAKEIVKLPSYKKTRVPETVEVVKILNTLFKDKKAMLTAINTYAHLHPDKPAFTLDTLTTNEMYGGFNTRSLQIDENFVFSPTEPNGIDYYLKTLVPAYNEYANKQSGVAYYSQSVDGWLREYREDYYRADGGAGK